MADIVVTLKIMPTSPEVDLEKVKEEAEVEIKEFGGELGKHEIEPVAFGIQSLNLFFVMDESLGSTEELEENLKKIKGVESVVVSDVRRALG